MLHHRLFSLTVVAVLALLSSAVNLPTLVNLRVEGPGNTIFEGNILTTGHNVTTALGGNHHCDGTNNGANPLPGPTSTSALDDASKVPSNLLTFDGTFSTFVDDFAITTISGVTQTANQFWGILINFEFTPVGGCQQIVNHNDEILFAFDAFNANAFLKLTGPASGTVHGPDVVTVTDGQTGKPVAGATVNVVAGVALVQGTTDANGHATVIFPLFSTVKLKATNPGAIRSNEITILVNS